jgi:hypothetical protein
MLVMIFASTETVPIAFQKWIGQGTVRIIHLARQRAGY